MVRQINLMIDPEGTKIALSAPFPNISKFLSTQDPHIQENKRLTVCPAIAGNVANQVTVSQEYLDDIYKVKNPYSTLMHEYYGTIFPLCMYSGPIRRTLFLTVYRGRDRCRYFA